MRVWVRQLIYPVTRFLRRQPARHILSSYRTTASSPDDQSNIQYPDNYIQSPRHQGQCLARAYRFRLIVQYLYCTGRQVVSIFVSSCLPQKVSKKNPSFGRTKRGIYVCHCGLFCDNQLCCFGVWSGNNFAGISTRCQLKRIRIISDLILT